MIKAALTTLTKHKAADLSKIAVAGYRQTGRHPLVFAAEVPISAAVVVRRGLEARMGGEQAAAEAARGGDRGAPARFRGLGEADHIISIEDVQRFRNILEANNKSYDIHIYKGAPHGWLNDTMPGRYRKPQADAGWGAQQRFLSEVFAGSYDPKRVSWRFESESRTDYDFTKNVRME